MSDAPKRIWLHEDDEGYLEWDNIEHHTDRVEPCPSIGYIRADLVEQYKAAIKVRLEEAYEAEQEGKYLADDILEILDILNGEADDD